MGIFSKSENELRQWDSELKTRQADLERLNDDLNSLKLKLDRQAVYLDAEKEQQRQIEQAHVERDAALARAEADMALREMNARAQFAQQQRASFESVIQAQRTELQQWDATLAAKQAGLIHDLALQSAAAHDLQQRELRVKERELKAEAAFADSAEPLLETLRMREAACVAKEGELLSRETDLMARHKTLEATAEALRVRKAGVMEAEQVRDAGYVELRRSVEAELHERRRTVESELAALEAKRLADLESELSRIHAGQLSAQRQELQAERDRFLAENAELGRSTGELLQRRRESLDAEAAAMTARSSELGDLQGGLEAREADVARREGRADDRMRLLGEEVLRQTAERKESCDDEVRQLREELDRLRDAWAQAESMRSYYDEITTRLGEQPELTIDRMKRHEKEMEALLQQLRHRPTTEIGEMYNQLGAENQRLEALNASLTKTLEDTKQQHEEWIVEKFNILGLKKENEDLSLNNERLEILCNKLREDLQHFQAAYQSTEERDKRIGGIQIPHIKTEDVPWPDEDERDADAPPLNEMAWLDSIERGMREYGFTFHRRILEAFHTSLKTAEWSPITVLAGVSGTGKSELPRLYSHFGGINFLSLAVQPNWDSQESMLGYFNSIDNKFDSQPVLRFLAQTQQPRTDDYPGLRDSLSLVLLDEMNLAHPELYLADFLSKLEARRGQTGKKVPWVEVKLGSGLEPYQLRLGRNVMWAGTINQDETTKSFSDKVLDRSIIIYFPRPAELHRRTVIKTLDNPAPLLSKKDWGRWDVRFAKQGKGQESNSFSEKELETFKPFIEEMNKALAKVGRAMGHRIWQSIEYYMANHPRVRANREVGGTALHNAMRLAFEDQLVQKVMPKLRGIETRGSADTDCLKVIRDQLINGKYKIVDDFDFACKLGHGQFMWQTANYLNTNAELPPVPATTPEQTRDAAPAPSSEPEGDDV